jgi:energy-coupling factor transporter ATP-binding protein EcfA2
MVVVSRDARWDALTRVLTLGQPAASATAVGRHDMVRKLFDVVAAPGEHAFLVGEPGLGKTSLLNVVAEQLAGAGLAVLRVEAAPGMSFDQLIRAAADGVSVAPDDEMRFAPVSADHDMAEPLADMLPDGEVEPGDVAELMDQTLAGRPVLMIDRYEAVGAGMTDRAVADLIKTLAENVAQATVLLAANADTAEDVHDNHHRTFRYLSEQRLRLLRPQETFHILDRASEAAGVGFDDDARKLILTASVGIPTAVQTLAQGAIAAAIRAGRETAGQAEALAGMAHAAAQVDAETRQGVDMVLGDDPEDEFAHLIFAVAAAHTDWYGRFFKPQVMESIRHRFPDLGMDESEIVQTLDSLCGDDAMSLFRKGGSDYRFRTIWVKHYVLMRYLAYRFGQTTLDPADAMAG